MRLLFPLQSMAQPWRKSFAWGGGGGDYFGQIFWEMFYMGTNDQIMQAWKANG